MRKCLTLFIFSIFFQLGLVQFTIGYFLKNLVWDKYQKMIRIYKLACILIKLFLEDKNEESYKKVVALS
jgi:hypothetical protein